MEEDANQQEQMWCAASQKGPDSDAPPHGTVQVSQKATAEAIPTADGTAEYIIVCSEITDYYQACFGRQVANCT